MVGLTQLIVEDYSRELEKTRTFHIFKKPAQWVFCFFVFTYLSDQKREYLRFFISFKIHLGTSKL
jgi:hypothetical protein